MSDPGYNDAVVQIAITNKIGYITSNIGGRQVSYPVELEITEIFYESGRKDVTIKVPELAHPKIALKDFAEENPKQ